MEQREFDERRFASRLQEMEKALDNYKAGERERDSERRQLEYELTVAARNAQMSELDSKEREAAMSQKVAALQNQIKDLLQEKHGYFTTSESAEKEIRRLREISMYLESERDGLDKNLNEAKGVIAGMQSALRAANTEAALVPQYQKELSIVPSLKAAAREAVQERDVMMDRLQEAEYTMSAMREEKNRLVHQIEQLTAKVSHLSTESIRFRLPPGIDKCLHE